VVIPWTDWSPKAVRCDTPEVAFYNTGVYYVWEEAREDKSVPVVSFLMNTKNVRGILITL
jgi:hypothetical protein